MFIEEYLQDLRRERYSLPAWLHYARRVAAHVRRDLLANPLAVRSIWTVALAYFGVAFAAAVWMSLTWDRELAERFFLHTSLWILPAFLFVTLFVGHLRDEQGHRLSGLNLPIMITLLRVSMVPGITLLLVERHFAAALVTYVIASLSDVLDGYLARRWQQTTPLGRVLDPLVDIVFNAAMLAGLAAAQLLASWVFWVAVLRYGVLLVGGAGLYLFAGPIRIQPTLFGRMTGVMSTFLIALFTLTVAIRGEVAQGLTRLTEIALGLMLSATVLQVIALGWYNLRVMTGHAKQAGKVVGDVRGQACMIPAALEGDLGHFFPSEVLQLLQLAQATGRLEFTRGVERIDLLYDRGRPVFARTSGLAVRVGEILLHRGVIEAKALARALESQRQEPRRRVGQLLVAAGEASPEAVRDAVHEVLRRIVYGVLLWRDGRFRFVPGESGVGEDIQLDLDLDRLILEGLRLADQERAARAGSDPA